MLVSPLSRARLARRNAARSYTTTPGELQSKHPVFAPSVSEPTSMWNPEPESNSGPAS